MNNLILKQCSVIESDSINKTITLQYTIRHDNVSPFNKDIFCKLHFSYTSPDFKPLESNLVSNLFLPRIDTNIDVTGTIKISVNKWFEKLPVYFCLKVHDYFVGKNKESTLTDNELRFTLSEQLPVTDTTPPVDSKFNDVNISSVILGKQSVELGSLLPVSLQYFNLGTNKINSVKLSIKLGDVTIHEAKGWGTNPGQNTWIRLSAFIPLTLPLGQQKLTFMLDPENTLNDINPSNNQTTADIDIHVDSIPDDEYSPEFGYGLINVKKAVELALELKNQPIPASVIEPIKFNLEDIPKDNVEIGILNTIPDVPPTKDIKLDATNAAEVQAHGLKGEGIIVAIVDTGVFSDHPDLKDNIWRDAQGRPGINFADDDYDTSDRIGHGTHVAGIVGAVQNNNRVTGVAPNVKLMPVKVLGGKTIGTSWDIAQGIKYAVDNGARVINISLGGHFPMQSVEKAIEYAASRNVIVVSAAGNSAGTTPLYPAAYASKYGIAVGAITPQLIRAGFSNKAGGDPDMVYVVAPGTNINSTTKNGRFGGMSGTSMAAPVVAGCVALILQANPNLTHEQVRDIIKQTATNY